MSRLLERERRRFVRQRLDAWIRGRSCSVLMRMIGRRTRTIDSDFGRGSSGIFVERCGGTRAVDGDSRRTGDSGGERSSSSSSERRLDREWDYITISLGPLAAIPSNGNHVRAGQKVSTNSRQVSSSCEQPRQSWTYRNWNRELSFRKVEVVWVHG